MSNLIDLTGKRFTRLVVLYRAPSAKSGSAWHCECDCGSKLVVTSCNLRSGNTKSCGCLKHEVARDLATKHGRFGTPEYAIWQAMRARCYNKKQKSFKNYGGAGVTVCRQWRGSDCFPMFFSDMGRRPTENHTIDRIDPYGNYEPDNCRWATRRLQANNQRRHHPDPRNK